jgi:quinol-cytochrome oxidoreductase complex cytochrome b subunit
VEASIRFNRTFGLGGMALLLFLLQIFTGILLRFEYVPVPEKAYDSILIIENEVLFGQFVRNLHHFSGVFFVLVAFLHFIRVFLSQSFYKLRRVNWVIGLAIFFLVMLSNFTGYLLPWDQLSYWAVTVATSMLDYIPFAGRWLLRAARGGTDVGAETLLNFYTFHTGLLPISLAFLMVYHFWKVRKAKGVALPIDERDSIRVPANPNLIFKEMVVGLVLMAFLLLLSALYNAPLLERANPSLSLNPAKAPWYFMGIQELLLHIHPFFAAFIIPALFFGGMVWLPYAKTEGINHGYWFQSEKGKKMAMLSTFVAAIFTSLYIIADEYFLHFEDWFKSFPQIVSQGLIPFILFFGGFSLYAFFLKWKYEANKAEVIISIFVVFIVSYFALTIAGIYFRGEGMKLIWLW